MENQRFILVAEDDPDDQELIAYAFSKVHPTCNLHVVSDGRQALLFLQNTPDQTMPCLIVLDYNMPELNGAQVIQKLMPEKRFEKIPKVILSTSGNPRYIEDAYSKGADAYRVKPADIQQLITIAKEMVALCESTS